jgi:hypothetical protein
MKPLDRPGEGVLSSNFIVYEGDEKKLEEALNRIRADYDPHTVVRTLKETQPHFYWGDSVVLAHFLEMCDDGKIHSQLHKEHLGLNSTIQTESA